MKKYKILGAAILLAVSSFAIACNKKKSDDKPADDTPAPEVNGKDPIVNDSGLPTTIAYNNEPSIMIHYQRYKGSYQPWCLWLWSSGLEGAEYKFNYSDDYGVIAYYPLATFNNPKSIGFIVKQSFEFAGEGKWVKDDISSDRFMDIDMLKIDEHQCYNVYLSNTVGGVYVDEARQNVMKAVKSVEFTSSTQIIVEANDNISDVVLKKNGAEIAPQKVDKNNKKVTITLKEVADIADVYTVEIFFDEQTKVEKGVSIRKLYDSAFDAKYNYDGELGAIYTATKTTFKVWSPVSKSIKLRIYENGTPSSVNAAKGSDVYEEYDMSKGEKGVFTKELDGDLAGKYYTYFVVNSSYPTGQEVVDPYAKSAGVSGLRGQIVNFDDTNPTGWDDVDYLTYDRKELTVYETHIAELTCSDTWGGTAANAKLFKGFYETGTTYKGVKTGFDHIKELGVNAVQIIPFFDQANDETNMTFNWGYNPLNYNVIEGGYSSDPYDGYVRIRELKELVKAYNEAGITIIMDVVYNHVNGLSGCQFDVLMPYYYFRYNNEGQASNGSGCGNETASDKYMYRKFMIDSAKFWTEEYKLGGFRFDLMGIHDIETMNKLVEEVKGINSHTVIYGEPWAGGTTALPAGVAAATQSNLSKYQGYGAFNDVMRDEMVKSGMNASYDRGWVDTDFQTMPVDGIVTGLQGKTGSFSDDPDKTINYVSCHDNYTIHDRCVVADITNPNFERSQYLSEEKIEKISALANALVFSSQGTSFMLAGEEMLRSKIVYDNNGNPVTAKDVEGNDLEGYYEVSGNSYSSPYKTNEINYQLKVDHPQLFATYQKLIKMKQEVSGLHNGKNDERTQVEVFNNKSIIKATFKDGSTTYVAYFASGATGSTSPRGTVYEPYVVNTSGYSMYLDTLGNSLTGSMTLQPFETLILVKQYQTILIMKY